MYFPFKVRMCLTEMTGKGDRAQFVFIGNRKPDLDVANCAAARPNDLRQLGSESTQFGIFFTLKECHKFHYVIRRLVCLPLYSSVIHSIPLPRVPPTSMFVPPPVNHHTGRGAYIKRKNIAFFTKPLIRRTRDPTAKCN